MKESLTLCLGTGFINVDGMGMAQSVTARERTSGPRRGVSAAKRILDVGFHFISSRSGKNDAMGWPRELELGSKGSVIWEDERSIYAIAIRDFRNSD